MGCPSSHLPRFQGKNRFWFFYMPHICFYLCIHTYSTRCRQGSGSLTTLVIIWEGTDDVTVNNRVRGSLPTLAQMGYSASHSHHTGLVWCTVYLQHCGLSGRLQQLPWPYPHPPFLPQTSPKTTSALSFLSCEEQSQKPSTAPGRQQSERLTLVPSVNL